MEEIGLDEPSLDLKIEDIFTQEEEAEDHFALIINRIKILVTRRLLKNDYKPVYVIPGLFIGSIGAALSIDELKRNNITHILVVAKGIKEIFANDFKYKRIELVDVGTEDIKSHFKECNEFIENVIEREKGKVMVHCYAGKSRSASVCIAYLMYKCCMSFQDAFKFLQTQRKEIEPNPGFIKQLESFQEQLPVPKQTVFLQQLNFHS